jgi:hypothetical protein
MRLVKLDQSKEVSLSVLRILLRIILEKLSQGLNDFPCATRHDDARRNRIIRGIFGDKCVGVKMFCNYKSMEHFGRLIRVDFSGLTHPSKFTRISVHLLSRKICCPIAKFTKNNSLQTVTHMFNVLLYLFGGCNGICQSPCPCELYKMSTLLNTFQQHPQIPI